jgi:hypothetical protein
MDLESAWMYGQSMFMAHAIVQRNEQYHTESSTVRIYKINVFTCLIQRNRSKNSGSIPLRLPRFGRKVGFDSQ